MDTPSAPAAAPTSPSSSSTPSQGSGQNQSNQTLPSSGGNTPSGAASGSSPTSQKGSTSQAQSTQPEYFEVTINGKPQRMTRDEVLNYASMSHAAQQKFDEAARIRKENDRLRDIAKTDFIQLLQDPQLGLTKDQIRERFEKWYTQEYIEPETLTQEQRQLKTIEQELKQYKDKEKEQQQKAAQEKEAKILHEQQEFLSQKIIDTLEASGLPKTKYIAGRMAFYMRQNALNGWEAPMEMIVQQVKKEQQDTFSSIVGESDIEKVIGMVGEDFINKIRQYDLKRLREKRQLQGVSPSQESSPTQSSSTGRISYSEVNQRLKNMRLGIL